MYVNVIVDIHDAVIASWDMGDEKDPRIITPMPTELLAAIDDFRFSERLPSRAEAIRRLIETSLRSLGRWPMPHSKED
jgi:hypothetical protein